MRGIALPVPLLKQAPRPACGQKGETRFKADFPGPVLAADVTSLFPGARGTTITSGHTTH